MINKMTCKSSVPLSPDKAETEKYFNQLLQFFHHALYHHVTHSVISTLFVLPVIQSETNKCSSNTQLFTFGSHIMNSSYLLLVCLHNLAELDSVFLLHLVVVSTFSKDSFLVYFASIVPACVELASLFGTKSQQMADMLLSDMSRCCAHKGTSFFHNYDMTGENS